MQLTADLIRSLCPHARDDYVAAFSSEAAHKIYAVWGVSAPRVLAAMMANIDHETGGLTIIRERMNHSEASARRAFGAATFARILQAMSLAKGKSGLERERMIANAAYGHRGGNQDDGESDDDGWRYRGGGPLQTTFKPNYRALEALTGVPYGSHPELIEKPDHWPLIACATFAKHPSAGNLVPYAEEGNFLACCKGINTGSPFSKIDVNGLEDRVERYGKWCAALGATPPAPSGVYRLGSPNSSAVEAIQARLNALRYAEGKLDVDGDFGDRTKSAVRDFQDRNELDPNDGVVGPKTWAVLFSDRAKPWPAPAAASLGIAGMRAAGMGDVVEADKDRAAAVTLFATAAIDGANRTGLLDFAGELAKDLQGWQAVLSTIISALKFGAGNMVSVGIIVAGLYLFNRYRLKIAEVVGKWLTPIPAKGVS